MRSINDKASFGVTVAILIVLLSMAARVPYLGQANLSPDAADYINIARNIAQGRGFEHSIKWHYFTDDPVVHSAVGERPLLYPLLLSPVAGGANPAIPGQYITALLAAIAVALGVAWAWRMGLRGAALLIATALLAFNPGLLMCSVYPWTEPLYLVWLFAILLIIEPAGESPWRAAGAGLVTGLAFLTRPSAPAIVLAIVLWYAWRRRWRPLAFYVVALLVVMIPWWIITWSVRGNPFYSLPKFHFVVGDIRDGMAAGYGRDFPSAFEFFAANGRPILSKAMSQSIAYITQLFGPTFLSLLSAFLFLRLARRDEGGADSSGPWALLALFHFLMPAATWATFDAIRFMLPCFAVLIAPVVGEADRLVRQLEPRRARTLAWTALLIVIGIGYADQWAQLYARTRAHRRSDRAMQVARVQIASALPPRAVIACNDPFSINYYLARPAIALPEPRDPSAWPALVERFLQEYKPDFILVSMDDAERWSALVARKRLGPPEAFPMVGLMLYRVEAGG